MKMKKFVACLCLGVLLLGVTACTNGKNNGDVPQKDNPEHNNSEKKELVDPRGESLDDTSTGESAPQMVNTLYETEDVVVADYVPTEMGYAVDPTGKTDSTNGIQSALDDCSEAGGGTVFLPSGNYAISDTIYIPPFVTLRGDWNDPDAEDFDGSYGTIISVWMESEDEEIAGAFRLGGSAGAVGLTVYYPEQSIECIRPYAYTFYVDGVGANFMLQTIKNVTIINGYRGIGTSYNKAHEELQVENVKGTFLKSGLTLNNSSDVSIIENVTIHNRYWKEASADCMNAVPEGAIDGYTKQYTTGLVLSDEEWTQFNNISVDGCAVGIHIVQGARISFAGELYDVNVTNCSEGILCDNMDERWGAVLAKGYIEGGITNNTEAKWKLCDVEVLGEKTDISGNSFIEDTETDFSDISIDCGRSYVKPASNFLIADLPAGYLSDATSELQAVLKQMEAMGGGVVYVPSGVYRFKNRITVPAGIELRGSSSVPTRDQSNYNQGTVFYCYYGDDASNGMEDEAFITLEGENSGLNGVRIIYPENGPKTDDLNTTYTLRSRTPQVKAEILASLVRDVWTKVEAGEVKPTIYKTLPITEAEAAQDILYSGENVGKVVLVVSE